MIKAIYLLFIFGIVVNSQAQVKTFTLIATSDTTISMTLLRATQNGVLHVADTINLEASKTFKHKITLETPTSAKLFLNKKPLVIYQLWLLPGSTLKVNFKDDDATFVGTGSEFANYYKKKDAVVKRYGKDYTTIHPDFRDNANTLITYIDSVTRQEEHFLESYFTERKAANYQVQNFLKQERISTLYSNLYQKLVFSGSDIERFKYSQYLFKSNKPAYSYSDQIEFKNVSLLSNPSYQKFAQQFVADIAFRKQNTGGKPFAIEPYVDIALQMADTLTQGNLIAIEIKALLLKKIIDEISRDRKDKWIPKVQATLNDLSVKNANRRLKILQAQLNNIIADTRFKPGNPAPDFVLTGTEGKKYSLKDFKGKKILIDVGASWCGPCVAGIPSWNKLVETYTGKNNVIFISLSLDDNEDGWQRWVKRKPKGLLLNADFKGFQSDFANAYLVTALPKMILLDEEGRIVQYNATVPNSEVILKMLNL
jgi:thiol-disulfide isomerase/thioredoxin